MISRAFGLGLLAASFFVGQCNAQTSVVPAIGTTPDCPDGLTRIPTSYGSVCVRTQSESAISGGEHSTIIAESAAKGTLAPARPIEPVFGAGPGDLPADFEVDMRLGYSSRGRMLNGASESTPNDALRDVFDRLITAGFREPVPWRLTLVNDDVINASSSAGGQVYLYGGLNRLVAHSPGLSAAVLSHEVTHTGFRHQVRTYMLMLQQERTRAYYRAQIQAGDNSANWGLLAFNIAAPIALKKMERDEEHQADSGGMLVMARAGYHPDFVFALHHLLVERTGEQSKFAAFFSDHPRWETRDQRSQKSYTDALAEFNKYWPNAKNSPGGLPPLVVFFGEANSIEDKRNGVARVHVPVVCRNGSTTIALFIEKNGQRIDTPTDLLLAKRIRCDTEAEQVAEFALPTVAFAEAGRKLKGTAVAFDDDEQSVGHSKLFDIRLPKEK